MKAIRTVLTSIFILCGCNMYGFIDKPSGEDQLLSAARACFDQGDFECAAEYYGRVSTDPTSSQYAQDQALAESTFLTLSKVGVDAQTFFRAIKDSQSGSAGPFISSLARSLLPQAGLASRLELFHAFQKNGNIQNDKLRGLIRFLSSIMLLSEILAETSTSGKVSQSNIVKDPVACNQLQNVSLETDPSTVDSCTKPAASNLVAGDAELTLDSATDAMVSGDPSLHLIHASIRAILSGLHLMGQATDGLGASTRVFSEAFDAVGPETIDQEKNPQPLPIFRWMLIVYQFGI